MLWARAVSEGVRTIAPEICAGIYTPEETQDFNEDAPVAPAAIIKPVSAETAATAINTVAPKVEELKTDAPKHIGRPAKVEVKQESVPAQEIAKAEVKLHYSGSVLDPRIEAAKPIEQDKPTEITKPVEAEIVEPEVVPSDADIVPIGKQAGKKLYELPDRLLGQIVAVQNPAFTDAHKSNAKRILAERAMEASKVK